MRDVKLLEARTKLFLAITGCAHALTHLFSAAYHLL